jgi:hypothetical protein
MWRASGFNSWAFLFYNYINDLPKLVNENNNLVLYADDVSIVITDCNRVGFNLQVNVLLKDINNCFKNNLLNINFTKTNYLVFRPSKYPKANILIHYQYNHKYVSNVTQTNLTLDDTLTWKQHTDLLITNMTSVSYAPRQVKYFLV